MVLIIVWAGISWALPVYNQIGDYSYIDTIDGDSFGYYTNSGKLLFIESGNNEGNAATLAAVEALVNDAMEDILGYTTYFKLTETTSITYAGVYSNGDPMDIDKIDEAQTGTWNVIPSTDTISFYAVKAGDAYAMYWVNPAEGSGSWSTYNLWVSELANSENAMGLEISHFTGYNPGSPVPEPATMFLFGLGLIGLAGLGRKKFKK